jgi:hypothetical protein
MNNKDSHNDSLHVLAHHSRLLKELKIDTKHQALKVDSAIVSSEALLKELNRECSSKTQPQKDDSRACSLPYLRSWTEIIAEAYECTPDTISFSDILSHREIQQITNRHCQLETEFKQLYSLDTYDYITCGIAGILGALVDIFLVKIPKHPSFLGSRGSSGGWLSNSIKEKFGEILPQETIKSLENQFKVSYDPSTSNSLKIPVPGMGPGTHRFQSLGHDPLVGWICGVRDLLTGEFTALGKDGTLIIQKTTDPFLIGKNLFMRVFEAFRIVGGHMASDSATERGLPAPLMPLLMFLQTGSIGKRGYTIGEVARQMYRIGYDFRHFIAASVPVIIIEIIVRLSHLARSVYHDASLTEAVPCASNPKLRSQLFLAHTVATSCNAGKVMITRNPLSLNWAQWLAFFRYLLPQIHWLLIGKEKERQQYIVKELNKNLIQIDDDISNIWKNSFSDEYKALL